jgi:metallo-beta-lactamase family protein
LVASIGFRRLISPVRAVGGVLLLTVGWSVLQLGLLMPVANHVTGSHQDMTVFADLEGSTTLLLGLLLASWTLAAVGEEAVFRGYLPTRMREIVDPDDHPRLGWLSVLVPDLHEVRSLGGDVTVELNRAGHILGSCFAAVQAGGSRIVFSGDLGRPDHPLLLPPEDPGPADYFVVESTYGDRLHHGQAPAELGAALARTIGRGGVALLPAFAVDRTAMLLHEIRALIQSGRAPDVPVYVDSPMALAALEVYNQSRLGPSGRGHFRPEVIAAAEPFDPGRLHLAASRGESEKLNDPHKPCIIISASGMATGGRVLHHLEHQLPTSRNSVILTGYQVAGTRGRALADGATSVKIHGRYIPVDAEVVNIRGYSAHADREQMVSWLRHAPKPRGVFVVHGEPDSAKALAHSLHERLGWTSVVPRFQEKVRVD